MNFEKRMRGPHRNDHGNRVHPYSMAGYFERKAARRRQRRILKNIAIFLGSVLMGIGLYIFARTVFY